MHGIPRPINRGRRPSPGCENLADAERHVSRCRPMLTQAVAVRVEIDGRAPCVLAVATAAPHLTRVVDPGIIVEDRPPLAVGDVGQSAEEAFSSSAVAGD